jgi:hypothetical protein
MGFGRRNYRNSGIQPILCYEDAVQKYKNTAPILRRRDSNGMSLDVRPLGHRRNVDAYQIKMSGEDVQCLLYRKPIITYRKDGVIEVRDVGYCSPSMVNFYNDIVAYGSGAMIYDFSLVIRQYSGDRYRVPKNGDTPLKLMQAGTGATSVIDPPKEYVYHVKRKELNEVRKMYTYAHNLIVGFAKLREGQGFSYDERKEIWGLTLDSESSRRLKKPTLMLNNHEDVLQFFSWIDNGEAYKAFAYLVDMTSWNVSPKPISKMFDNFVMARHKHEVFNKIELPMGVVRKNEYRHMFS